MGSKFKKDAWNHFGLSYASWLVIPRIALQSMPENWQHKFFNMVDELNERIEFPEGFDELNFTVTARKNNRFVKHIIPRYKHSNLTLRKKHKQGK